MGITPENMEEGRRKVHSRCTNQKPPNMVLFTGGMSPSGYYPQHSTHSRRPVANMGHASDRIDVPDRYELFILDEEKGEKKVTYILDTRKISPHLLPHFTLLTIHNRRPKHRHLHLQQRRPHTRQPPHRTPPQLPLRPLLRLQSSPPPLRDIRITRLD